MRLAELVAALSLGIDLGFGQPMEHVLRQCLIALRLAERIGLNDDQRADVYWTALLVDVGCHTDAHEQAKWFGDDIANKSLKYDYDLGSTRQAVAGMRSIGRGAPLLHRFRIGIEFMISGRRDLDRMIDHHAAMARLLGEQLSLSGAALDGLSAAYEMYDGKGWPGELEGDDIPMASRISAVAEFTEVAHRVGGVDAVRDLMRRQRGKQFDPMLADAMAAGADMLLADLDEAASTWQTVIDAEPALGIVLDEDGFDQALTAVANFVDLKSPYFLGHATAVADLTTAATMELGFAEADARALRRAALISGFGRLGISNAIWDKHGKLGAGEWERVRLHPYLTERMVYQSEALAGPGAIAVQLRERLDGSGYPRRLSGPAISRSARILAAADAYQAMREPRPHRDPLSMDDAAAQLRGEVRAGHFDADAVEAVLGAAGHRVLRRREGPGGLTAREVEVLKLLARGLTNKDIAAVLTITPKTVGNHVEHIYTKIGLSSRAAASLFAMQHGLLPEEEFVPA